MKNLLEQAYNSQKNGHYKESTELFLKIREHKDYYEIATLEIAKNYKMSNNPTKAIDYFIELLNYNNNNKEAIKELSQTACLSKNYKKAEEILKELFNKTKQNVFLIELIKIYFDKGCLHEIEKIMNDKKENKVLKDILDALKNNDSDKNIDFYNKKIEQKKDDYLLYLERAKLERNLGKYEQALIDFDMANHINNKDPYVLFERGRLKKEIKNYKGALEDFTEAINLNSKIYWFFLDLAMLQEELGEYDKYLLNLRKALDVLNKDLICDNDNIQLHINKFCIQRYLGVDEDMSLTLNKIKELNNNKSFGKYIDNIQSVALEKQKSAPYRCIFTWVMSPKCNYNCTYCSVRLFEHVKENIVDDKNINEIIDSWKNIYDKYGSSRIRLTGGEPSIYPNFFKILSVLSKYHRLQLGTNLSFDVNKFCDVSDPETIRVDASLHCEYVKLEDFIKKIEILKNNKYKVSVSYVAYPDFIKNITNVKKIIESMNIPFLVHPFSGIYKGKIYPLSYTEEERRKISMLDMKNTIEFKNREKINGIEENYFDRNNKFIDFDNIKKINELKKNLYLKNKKDDKYKMCKMGQMYAYIYPNGNTYRCCSSFNENYLGNLFDKSISLLEKAEKCYDINNCKCWRCMVLGEESRWLHTWLDDWEMEIWKKK